MTLEIILWILAWVVISEVGFIISLKKLGIEGWVQAKLLCFVVGALFMAVQIFIVFMEGESQYINLLYEFIILGIIAALFLINKRIVDYIKKKEAAKKKSKGRKIKRRKTTSKRIGR
ncbi:unnamed protein product [marine sediment metagenome]|uniref:Uncharacterized protein n=1 Tax=marine sediment metagenome TaxID=412755 RepID=X0S546_9ZZZZ